MSRNLKRYGDWALVTGASAGIGMEFARALAKEGLNLILIARRRVRLETLSAELIEKYGIETLVIEQDLGLPDSTDWISGAVGERQPGMLVLNAGFGYYGRFAEMEEAALRQMVEVNCTSVALLARRFVPDLIERRRGALIIVSSVLGFFPGPWISAYSATKAFDLMLGESLRPELKSAGVDVLNLCPATTDTEFHQIANPRNTPRAHAQVTGLADPRAMVKLALEGLGRKATVFPGPGYAASLLTRLLPRKWTANIAGLVMARDKGVERQAD